MEEIDKTIQDKIDEFTKKYNTYPTFLKIPLWVYKEMKREMTKIRWFKIDYVEDLIKYRNLAVCPTIAIQGIEEIEVF